MKLFVFFALICGVFLVIHCPSYAITASHNIPAEALVNQSLDLEVRIREEWIIDRAEWDFQDGNPNVFGRKVSHAYSEVGIYTINIHVFAYHFVEAGDGTFTKVSGDVRTSWHIQIKAKVQVIIDPVQIKKEKGNSSGANVHISLKDYDDKDYSFYNESISITSSNIMVARVASQDVNLSWGRGVGYLIAGDEGSAEISVVGDYLVSGGCAVEVVSNDSDNAGIDYLEIIDMQDKKRYSRERLQLVCASGESRTVRICVYKDDKNKKWADDEPLWEGLYNSTMDEFAEFEVSSSGVEHITAQGQTKTVGLEIFEPDEVGFSFAGQNAITEISAFSEKIASTFKVSVPSEKKPLKVTAHWKYVEVYGAPEVGRMVQIVISGQTAKFEFDAPVPGWAYDLPLVKAGLFLTAGVYGSADMNYKYDPSLEIDKRVTGKGAISIIGSLGGKVIFDLDARSIRVMSKVDFPIPVIVSAKFLDTDPDSPQLSTKGAIAPVTVTLDVLVRVREFEWERNFGNWPVFKEEKVLWNTGLE